MPSARLRTESPPAAAAASLAEACRALWLATLSLMTAFMQTSAPAHRLLLARRIVGNLQTLGAQDCFDASTRASFARVAARWERQVQQHAPQDETSSGGRGLLQAWRSFAGIR